MVKQNMKWDELNELLNAPAGLDRTLTYIQQRHCVPYRPGVGYEDHNRLCFNCQDVTLEGNGLCYGNGSCEIWVCKDCSFEVKDGLLK